MYEYEDDDEGSGRSIGRIVIGAIVAVALVAGGWFLVRSRSGGDDDDAGGVITVDSPASSAGDSTVGSSASSSASPESTAPETSIVASTADVTTTAGTTTTARATTTTERARRLRQRQRNVTYDTLPDGSPAPVVAIFDANQITLTGAVPDEAAKDRLQALALANAKPGQGDIVNFLTINPDVPRGIGVRVVELTSARFPTGSAEIRPPQAAEIDRVVSIMSALPKITALVIGHSDQRGDAVGNYELSAARAEAVINYLASKGVAPDRLSSRAVGEADLLTLNNDDAALALNRRTEFVFYGLLID
jgi:outer membrane protein OmpA-like peptidoglycan-associated protein